MRKVLIEICKEDKQAELAAIRIAKALSEDREHNIVALDDITNLRLKIRDLQRKNLELQFLVDNPDFDVDMQISKERDYLVNSFINNESIMNLYARYSYDYFSDNYHPEFITKLCTLLYNVCIDKKAQPNQLWSDLLITSGFITKDIISNYGPVETDKGII
jgi:hypothetical protein